MGTENGQLLGLASPRERGSSTAEVIGAVEQVNGGDTLISIGGLAIFRDGGLSRINERATVRLTADEREELIRQLMTHRFTDMTAEFGSEEQR